MGELIFTCLTGLSSAPDTESAFCEAELSMVMWWSGNVEMLEVK
jgi:hypothetical protein